MVTSNLDKALPKSSESETSFVWRLFEKARKLPESVPGTIREELATLAAEVNGKTDALKQATKENADRLKSEVQELAKSTSQKYIREWKTAEFKNNKKYEKFLGHAKSFDDVRAGDILRMRASGENIAKYLLTDEEWDEVNLDASNIDQHKNKKLLVNFGINKSINASIGLGDILPYEAKKVEITKPNWEVVIGILWSEDSRKWRRERVGYYDEKTGKYIAIYTGYKLSILESGNVSEQERSKYENIQQLHINNLRIKEMLEVCIVKNGYKKITPEEVKAILTSEFPEESDQALFDQVSQKLNDRIVRGEHIRDSFKDGMGSRERFIGKFGWYFRDVIAKDFPNIPAHTLVNLFDQESKFNAGARNPTTGAYGLGQVTPDTWNFIEEKSNENLDKESPYDQIKASALYLDWIMKNNDCTIDDAVIYYHMGHNVKKLMNSDNQEWLSKYINANRPIAELMNGERSWNSYWNAAKLYYLKQPHLLQSLDLSNTGTELASKLGDYVMSTSLPDTGNNSCGAAVWLLLNRFWIEALPQNGRDGKNWDDILEPRIHSWQFKKTAIKHPDEASAWAILVYDGSGQLGSEANKAYGHVEIKWSDGKYYSYYEWQRAGWSAATMAKNPEEYQKLTWFTGFAYYPVSRQA